LWLPVPLKRCDFGLETGRYLAQIGLDQCARARPV
jgi:hypothetical protein